MHETGLFAITLYLLFGATIAGFIMYIQQLAAKYFHVVKTKILKQKEQPPIEWY